MRRSIIACALLLTIAGIGALSMPSATASPTTAPSTQPINKMCAIQHEEKIDPKVTYVYDGKTIGFCCADCIPEFKKDPEKYVKELK